MDPPLVWKKVNGKRAVNKKSWQMRVADHFELRDDAEKHRKNCFDSRVCLEEKYRAGLFFWRQCHLSSTELLFEYKAQTYAPEEAEKPPFITSIARINLRVLQYTGWISCRHNNPLNLLCAIKIFNLRTLSYQGCTKTFSNMPIGFCEQPGFSIWLRHI